MKKILIGLLMIASISLRGQTRDSLWMPVLNDKVGIQSIILLDSINSKEILQRTRLYFIEKYNSGKDVIQLDDIEQNLIIGKGISKVSYSMMLTTITINIKYMLRVEAKDNKCRYTIEQVLTKGTESGFDYTPIENWWRYPNMSKKQCKLFGEELKAIATDFENYIKKPSVSKSDKW